MKNFTLIYAICVMITSLGFFESAYGKSIPELKEANFDDVVNGSSFVFVIFYAPWNKRSVEALKTLEDVSKEMNKNDVILAKVNAYDEVKLATRFWIDNWPMFRFFIKGSVTPQT
jgi:thioredoxin-like negative regulator of GroEL